MSEPLPVGQFRFLEQHEIDNFDLMSSPAVAETGYILDCELAYPETLHQLHNDYPMAPENLTVDRSMSREYTLGMIDKKWKPTQKWFQICRTKPSMFATREICNFISATASSSQKFTA